MQPRQFHFGRLWMLVGCAMALVSNPSAAWSGTPGVSALTKLEHGLWELSERGSKAPPRRICLSDPLVLTQLRHSGRACSRFVIENQPDRATLHYTCPGAGHGRTTIRVETPRLAQIDTQGIAESSPFEARFEGRFVGRCR